MSQRLLIASLVLVHLLVTCVDFSEALPRRRRRGGGNTNYYYNYYPSGGSVNLAAKVDSASAGHRPLKVYYSYDLANQPELAYTDKFRVFTTIHDPEIAESNGPLVAEVRITELSESDVTKVIYAPVKVSRLPDREYWLGEIDIGNGSDGAAVQGETLVGPSRVYRCFINLHRAAEEYGDESVLGRVPSAYYVATSGPSELDRARQHIVMRTFKEWYYTERGWASDESYYMDCHDYYLWATGSCTIGASNGRTILGRLFRGRTPYCDSSQIAQLADEGPIHADYVRIPGHTFMLLAYDSEHDRVWTMEGNFGASIEIAVRPISSGWTVGHLHGDHIRAELFPATDLGDMGDMDDMMGDMAENTTEMEVDMEAEADTMARSNPWQPSALSVQ